MDCVYESKNETQKSLFRHTGMAGVSWMSAWFFFIHFNALKCPSDVKSLDNQTIAMHPVIIYETVTMASITMENESNTPHQIRQLNTKKNLYKMK